MKQHKTSSDEYLQHITNALMEITPEYLDEKYGVGFSRISCNYSFTCTECKQIFHDGSFKIDHENRYFCTPCFNLNPSETKFDEEIQI